MPGLHAELNMAEIPHTKPVISDGLSIVAMIHYDSNFKQQAPMFRTLGCIPERIQLSLCFASNDTPNLACEVRLDL